MGPARMPVCPASHGPRGLDDCWTLRRRPIFVCFPVAGQENSFVTARGRARLPQADSGFSTGPGRGIRCVEVIDFVEAVAATGHDTMAQICLEGLSRCRLADKATNGASSRTWAMLMRLWRDSLVDFDLIRPA